jgi:hypothetical protein
MQHNMGNIAKLHNNNTDTTMHMQSNSGANCIITDNMKLLSNMGYYDNSAWLRTKHILPLHLLSQGGIWVYSQPLPLSVSHDTAAV